MTGRDSLGKAARLLCAAAAFPFVSAPAFAQQPPAPPVQTPQQPAPDAAELDPSAPLAPMPDLGVEWPDLNAREQIVAPGEATAKTTPVVNEGTGEIRYAWTIEGITGVGNAEELLQSFRKQSALEADRKDAANAAQIGRRSRADADLLAELRRDAP